MKDKQNKNRGKVNTRKKTDKDEFEAYLRPQMFVLLDLRMIELLVLKIVYLV